MAQQEACPDGILTIDADGRILSFNRLFAQMWGISEEALASGSDERALEEAVSKLVEPEAFLERVRHLYAHREERSRDDLLLLDGRTFERNSAPIIGENQVYYGRVWFFRDVTERKRAEQTKAVYERERLQREFVATVSHELRTPITAILGFAETLLEGGLNDAKNRREFVTTIVRHAQRLSRLVEDILVLSVLETGKRGLKRELVKISDLIEASVTVMEPLARREKISIRFKSPAGLRLSADPAQLSRVLLNLVENAVKYNHTAGWIEVDASTAGADLLVRVSNSGLAIPPQDLVRIFERFHRVEPLRTEKVRGTGLGLAIAKEIVELHGGRIWAESPESGGCVLNFTLPLSPLPLPS